MPSELDRPIEITAEALDAFERGDDAALMEIYGFHVWEGGILAIPARATEPPAGIAHLWLARRWRRAKRIQDALRNASAALRRQRMRRG